MSRLDLINTVSCNIKMYRQQKGLTQEALAYRAGLASRHIQKIEAGQVNLTLQTLSKIANALEVEPSEIMKK